MRGGWEGRVLGFGVKAAVRRVGERRDVHQHRHTYTHTHTHMYMYWKRAKGSACDCACVPLLRTLEVARLVVQYGKRDLLIWQNRPTNMAKQTYCTLVVRTLVGPPARVLVKCASARHP